MHRTFPVVALNIRSPLIDRIDGWLIKDHIE